MKKYDEKRTHYNQTPLRAKNGITRQVRIAIGIQRRRELDISRSLNHHVQVIGTHVVSIEVDKELPNGSLKAKENRLDVTIS